MSVSQRHPNQNEIDKCLRDAGVSDDLSIEEKLEFYNAIKVSESFTKDTSPLYEVEPDNNIEGENEFTIYASSIKPLRRNRNVKQKPPQTTPKETTQCYIIEENLDDNFSDNEIIEKEFKEKENEDPEWQPSTSSNRQNKNLKRKLTNTSQPDSAKRKANDILQKDVNIFDSSTSQHSPLKRISIPLVYEKQFLYRKELDRMNFSDRLKAIYKHHVFLAQKYKQALQKSRIFIKWGKPVLPSSNFNGSMDKLEDSIDKESENDEVNFLLSQKHTDVVHNDTDKQKSGTAKRVSQLNEVQNTNNTNMETEISRKENSSPSTEISIRSIQGSETEMETNENEELIIESSSPELDILKDDLVYMNVSKNKKFYSGNSSRSEIMFDHYMMQEKKRTEQQKEMDRFEETLNVLSDEEFNDFVSDRNSNRVKKKTSGDDAYVVKETQKDENTPWRRTIPPPNPMAKNKRQTSSKKAIPGKKTVGKSKSTPKNSKQQMEEDQKTHVTLSVKTPERNKKPCPICHQKFSNELIQEHLESCINSVESEDESEPNAFVATIKCDICGKFFKFNTYYEIHVNNCIRKCNDQ